MSSCAPVGDGTMLGSVFSNPALRCEKGPFSQQIYVLYSLCFFLLFGIMLGPSLESNTSSSVLKYMKHVDFLKVPGMVSAGMCDEGGRFLQTWDNHLNCVALPLGYGSDTCDPIICKMEEERL